MNFTSQIQASPEKRRKRQQIASRLPVAVATEPERDTDGACALVVTDLNKPLTASENIAYTDLVLVSCSCVSQNKSLAFMQSCALYCDGGQICSVVTDCSFNTLSE